MTDLSAELKKLAAARAVDLIADGMVVGLGTGSTSKIAIDLLGQKVQAGALKHIVGVPTSEFTAAQAEALGIPLGTLEDYPALDIALDGADEVTPEFNVTKGWGGALVREKIVETQAARLVIMVDDSKLTDRLGMRGPIPVEVTPFAWRMQAAWLAATLNCRVSRREENGRPYITDNQNYILNCVFDGGIADPHWVHRQLAGRTGLVGHGLFLDMATDVIVATATEVKHWQK